jgi:excisionase family DNA binding protein
MADRISPARVAKELGISPRTAQRWVREGRIPAIRVGGRWKVDPGALRSAVGGQPRQTRRLLVANRGELVVRIARTCRRLGIDCLALVAEDQRDAWWVSQADEALPLAGSYLDIGAVVEAARTARADAIHPGYGFLAEDPAFAEAVEAAGFTWVGPPPSAMRALGDKSAARKLATKLGVPVLPGYDGRGQSDAILTREAQRIGYPVLIKPSAGGGGKGMHVVGDAVELRAALARARREAAAAFGDARLILERYVEHPRHVEIQLLLDRHGGGVHLGERDCSLQRRHQKVVEEAPAPGVDPALRARMGEAALRLATAAGYVGAGTAEFLLEGSDFHFLELNARLQVEHPVTESVTGRDLVADQLRLAVGEPLGLAQAEVTLSGHAIEARLYAEDPWAGFLPATGSVLRADWPTVEGVRVDAGVGVGDRVGTRYDPLLAKFIARGDDREEAIERLLAALTATRVAGLTTNRGFLRWLLRLPEFRDGHARTDTIEARWRPGGAEIPGSIWSSAAAALARAGGVGPARPGFRLNAMPVLRLVIEGEERSVAVPEELPDADARPLADPSAPGGAPAVLVDLDGRSIRVAMAQPPTIGAALEHATAGGERSSVSAPMPGTILSVPVAPGDQVAAHDVLIVLEAMKMENAVTAPADAKVERVLVSAGQTVQRGDRLVELG